MTVWTAAIMWFQLKEKKRSLNYEVISSED